MQRTKKVSVFLIAGLLIVGAGSFANEIGLTLDAGWGKARIAILVLGLFVGLFPWIPWTRSREKTFQSDLFAFPALLLVIAVYLWFISVSRDSTSNYYALLAASFQQGELSLSLRPDPALLELANPYDPAARQGIKVPLDLSLYNDKFYLYWGPAPALLLTPVKMLFHGQVPDVYLLFAFVCGIFLSQFLLILHLWERFFPAIPRWMVLLSVFVAGFISPTVWLLNRPKIYEAAIAGGQFFFIAGLLAAYTALDRPTPSNWRLFLAGLFWSLAVGTRSVLVFPIAFMTLMVVTWFYRLYRQSWLKLVGALTPFGMPLVFGAVAFAWYNWARFGSVSETGFSYAMSGPYLQEHLNELFLPAYIFQNLYNYLFHPFTVEQTFPFLYAVRGMFEEVLPWQVLPEIYSAQAITGILWAAPFTIFAVVPAARLLKQLFKKNKANASEDPQTFSLHWITLSLTGSFLLSFGCLLIFFWAAMRYAEDFMPTLTLLSIIGFWHGHQILSQNSNKGKMYTILGLILAGLSILIGTFLALSVYSTSGLL